jgi:hypothetical protein
MNEIAGEIGVAPADPPIAAEASQPAAERPNRKERRRLAAETKRTHARTCACCSAGKAPAR